LKRDEASQMIAKLRLTSKKVMLCLGLEGIIHYELLPPGKTIDATNQQLMRSIQENRPELIKERTLTIERMLSFIITPHTSLTTR